jgi:DNA-binding response OmpR family regulator
MKVGRPIFSTRWERVGFCLLPADGSFNLTKRVDRNEGLTTIALSSSVAALMWGEAIRPAVVVLDLGLQGTVTGKTILQHVRANPRLRGTRSVAADGLAEEVAELADVVLGKAVGFEDLRGRVVG